MKIAFLTGTILSGLLYAQSGLAQQKQYTVTGKIVDQSSGAPIDFAVVSVNDNSHTTFTNQNGNFTIQQIKTNQCTLSVHLLGYSDYKSTFTLQNDTTLLIPLQLQSFYLNEVEVMGTTKSNNESSSVIDRVAMQYVQPASLADLAQLLPGQLTIDGNLSQKNGITLRQTGSDNNSTFGLSIIADGAPLSNNASMLSFSNSKSDTDLSSKLTVNEGIDLRQLSTDHIQSVEVVRGIASVKYGDLTNGAVITKAKSGRTPLQIRLKLNPINKLIYAGKGFKLPGKAGNIHIGADVTQATPDVRNNLEKFTRISSQVNYENRFTPFDKELLSQVKVLFVTTADGKKDDADLMKRYDTYTSRYNRIQALTNQKLNLNLSWINSIEATISADYSADILNRSKQVTLNGPTPAPIEGVLGEHEGIYLPTEYRSNYKTENKPFSLFAQLTGTSLFTKDATQNRLLYGVEHRFEKNLGRGSIYDPLAPPYINSSFGAAGAARNRNLSEIPAMQTTSFFAENRLLTEVGENKFDLTVGLRGSMLHTSSNYALSGKIHAEPRANLYWSLPSFAIAGKDVEVGIRTGYGEQVKYPGLEYIYPNAMYHDGIALNYFSQTEENRLLVVNTQKYDRTNTMLTAARNRIGELGLQVSVGDFKVAGTLFREQMNNGFGYQTIYQPRSFQRYGDALTEITQKPTTDQFASYTDTVMISRSVPVNISNTVKQGFEYDIQFPKIEALYTTVQLNGAYYHTSGSYSMPIYDTYSIFINNKPYSYVGKYEATDQRVSSRFNTNCFFNTHIPRFGLFFTTTIQCIWFERSQIKEYAGVPVSYFGKDGIERPFTEESATDPELKYLVKTFSNSYFLPSKRPVSFGVNLKATKELGKHLRCSFYVNRLFEYSPSYTDNLQVTRRNRTTPSFGAELMITL